MNSATRLDPSAPAAPCPETSGKLDEADGLFGEALSDVGIVVDDEKHLALRHGRNMHRCS